MADAYPKLFGAIFAALIGVSPVPAASDLKLLREKVILVDPPFVHAHKQVEKSGPQIVEFKMAIIE